MTKETEVVERLDRIIDLIEIMSSDESKSIKKELKDLHDWRITMTAEKSTKTNMMQLVRWVGPWIVALAFVLFEHKFKVL